MTPPTASVASGLSSYAVTVAPFEGVADMLEASVRVLPLIEEIRYGPIASPEATLPSALASAEIET